MTYAETEQFVHRMWPEIDWDESHFRGTPNRFQDMLQEMTTPQAYNFTTFPNNGVDEMVVLKDLPFYALCAHHIVPFFGVAHIAYIPNERIAGLSKFARAVRERSRGLWVQEELNQNLANFLQSRLNPIGVAVVMKAEHLCMAMRGAQIPGVVTTTSAMLGAFADHDKQARAEFLALIRD